MTPKQKHEKRVREVARRIYTRYEEKRLEQAPGRGMFIEFDSLNDRELGPWLAAALDVLTMLREGAGEPCPDCEDGAAVKEYCSLCEGPIYEECTTCKGTGLKVDA